MMEIADFEYAMKIVINEIYPFTENFSDDLYTMDDLVHQLVFEIIKEEYKRYAPRGTITSFLNIYDIDASNRKYTRALQYAQHYRDCDNSAIEDELGFRVPELEAQDMSGANVFEGHRFTAQEFLELKLQAECELLNKLHEKQIESSKNVCNTRFCELFEEYEKCFDELEPRVGSDPENVIRNTFVYYGIETQFLTEYLYHLTLAAEDAGFPKECPSERIKTVCSLSTVIPATYWCPGVFMADFCMIPKWQHFCKPIFCDSHEEWRQKEDFIQDCKQIKNRILQNNLDKLVEMFQDCTIAAKAQFIEEHYWIWGNRAEFEWTPARIQYYRKLHAAVTRGFSKPHIK